MAAIGCIDWRPDVSGLLSTRPAPHPSSLPPRYKEQGEGGRRAGPVWSGPDGRLRRGTAARYDYDNRDVSDWSTGGQGGGATTDPYRSC